MRRISFVLWGFLALVSVLWVAAEPGVVAPASFFAFRAGMIQYSGVLAIGCMSLAMILALRPHWPERWFHGLDKMYRLHKWLGIAAFAVAVLHWLWTQAPKWAVGLGWLERPARGARAAGAEPLLAGLRDSAEGLGEWAFYASVLLIVVALVQLVPYWLFYRLHRVIGVPYLVLVYHSVVLLQPADWLTPIGAVVAVLMAYGSWAAIVSLVRRIGVTRQVRGSITALTHYPGVRALEVEIDVPAGWPGHQAGQFAFVTSDRSEGAHPYTIASAWDPAVHHIAFIAKALGDHTGRLRETLAVGQAMKIEGPYGCFTFDDGRAQQIWVGAGIGITPFIGRMKYRAHRLAQGQAVAGAEAVELFHSTAEYDATAEGKLREDARAGQVTLHFLLDARDGRLTGERIRAAVPGWREASIWFCGPAGFGEALRRDFAGQGFPVEARFHQELFSMR